MPEPKRAGQKKAVRPPQPSSTGVGLSDGDGESQAFDEIDALIGTPTNSRAQLRHQPESGRAPWEAVNLTLARGINIALTNVVGIVIVLCGLGVGAVTVYLGAQQKLTNTDLGILQAISLALSLAGSFWIGRKTASEAAKEMIRPRARSAFRRLLSLYEGLGRLQVSVDRRLGTLDRVAVNDAVALTLVHSEIEIVRAQVIEQIGTADDAMEDWRDLVPEEIAALENLQRQRLDQ